MNRSTHSRLLFLCLLLTFGAGQACGPDFSPDVFVRPNYPDLPAKYAAGQLGLLQPGFARAALLVAYRYLNGGALDSQEQSGWTAYPASDPQQQVASNGPVTDAPITAVARWTLARKQYPNPPAGMIEQRRVVHSKFNDDADYQVDYLNCADDAFNTAAATLANRAALWGSSSPALLDWLHAQDAVFADCPSGSGVPGAVPPGSPALLASDRAYQIAAANFYSLGLPTARAQFLAISQDKNSPWQSVAGYLVARTMVRQAFFARHDVVAQASFDPTLMSDAAQQLRDFLAAQPATASLRKAAEAELALVRIRVDPDHRAQELGALVGGPGHDPNYAQDLEDLLWLVNEKTPDGLRAPIDPLTQVDDENHPGQMRTATAAEAVNIAHDTRQKTYAVTAPLRALSPVIDWTLTTESLDPAAGAHALAEWRRTHTQPWLIAALTLAPDANSPDQPLLAAAASVAKTSPAWETASYHRVRLLLASGHADLARAVLADALPQIEQPGNAAPSSINAFRGLAMRAAPTLAGFLEFAPRKVLLVESEEQSAVDECRDVMKNPGRHYNCVTEISPNQFDGDAANFMNAQAPLRVWLLASQSSALSAQLRQALAIAGWSRAVLLHDNAAALAFLPLLPEALRNEAGSGAGFEQLVVLAHNPGLGPYLNAGIQRSYSYDFVESYRDNWCYKPGDPGLAPPASFLKEDDRKIGAEQAHLLAGLRAADVGGQIVDYVRAHPDDPRAAESLYLVLRMIRYGCTEPAPAPVPPPAPGGIAHVAVAPPYPSSAEAEQLLKVKQEATRLLRRRYATSPWTRKAAPFAG